MRSWTRLIITVIGLAVSAGRSTWADEPRIQELEWNVFLRDWQLLGPFPKEDVNSTGLDTSFVQDEARLRGGQVVFYKNKLYTWKALDERVINFRRSLKVQGPPGDHVVAYAWTRFTSPVAQKGVLAVAYDDTFVAWVNGKEACRGTDNWASSLDQQRGEVELQAGVNTLLLKVGQGVRLWDAAARFLPSGHAEPLLTFRCQPGDEIARLPTVGVTLLDKEGKPISKHLSSGSRKSWPGPAAYYALYADMPDSPPTAVRFSFQEDGFRKFDQQFPWRRVRSGNVVLELASDRPLELLVVDKSTRQPIPDVEVWSGQAKAAAVSNDQGRLTLPEFNPLASQCWVAARGYTAYRLNVAWPRGKIQRVELAPGGRIISGVILSASGEPVPGATIASGAAGFSPRAVTDKNGRFELFGLPESVGEIYPAVTCPGYISKDSFALPLSDGPVTTVKWVLSPAG